MNNPLGNNKKPELLILAGPSGCGKSTQATEFIEQNTGWVRVNRDDIRRQLMGKIPADYYKRPDTHRIEKHITTLQDEQIKFWLQQGYNVIVDNTHLRKKYLDHYLKEFLYLADIQFQFMTAPLEVLKENLLKREGPDYSTEYLAVQLENYKNLVQSCSDYTKRTYRCPELSGFDSSHYKKCILVDIDGTIADCRGIRSPYDGDKVHLDRPIPATRELLRAYKGSWWKNIFNPVKIIYLSGRSDKYKNSTITWIKENGFPFDGLIYMRAEGDNRNDRIVKEELYYNHVQPYYNPTFVIDDRLAVCNMWYRLGLFVLNVNQGLKHF